MNKNPLARQLTLLSMMVMMVGLITGSQLLGQRELQTTQTEAQTSQPQIQTPNGNVQVTSTAVTKIRDGRYRISGEICFEAVLGIPSTNGAVVLKAFSNSQAISQKRVNVIIQNRCDHSSRRNARFSMDVDASDINALSLVDIMAEAVGNWDAPDQLEGAPIMSRNGSFFERSTTGTPANTQTPNTPGPGTGTPVPGSASCGQICGQDTACSTGLKCQFVPESGVTPPVGGCSGSTSGSNNCFCIVQTVSSCSNEAQCCPAGGLTATPTPDTSVLHGTIKIINQTGTAPNGEIKVVFQRIRPVPAWREGDITVHRGLLNHELTAAYSTTSVAFQEGSPARGDIFTVQAKVYKNQRNAAGGLDLILIDESQKFEVTYPSRKDITLNLGTTTITPRPVNTSVPNTPVPATPGPGTGTAVPATPVPATPVPATPGPGTGTPVPATPVPTQAVTKVSGSVAIQNNKSTAYEAELKCEFCQGSTCVPGINEKIKVGAKGSGANLASYLSEFTPNQAVTTYDFKCYVKSAGQADFSPLQEATGVSSTKNAVIRVTVSDSGQQSAGFSEVQLSDVNNDSCVNTADYGLLTGSFAAENTVDLLAQDINWDGIVNGYDISILLENVNLGTGCGFRN